MSIIKSDWNKFKAKFSDNPQKNFEWLCYLLFCREFDKPMGIERYTNQSGIETFPMILDYEVIGWQAKFYEIPLSQHKNDLLATINKSKRDYPDITKIIFYTNSEWGQGRGKNDPQAKVESEKLANDLGITLEWRTASFFESPFVTIDNKNITQYFFSFEDTMVYKGDMANDSFLNKIILNLAESNHTIADNLLNSFLNSIMNSSPDPNWRYDINILNNRFSIIETPRNELEIKQLPKKIEIKIRIPEQYESFESLMDLLEYARRKQITINLEVEEIKRYAGNHIVEHIVSKYRYNYVIEFEPPQYPILNLDIEFIDVDLMFHNVELKVIEVTDNNRITFSNKDQKDCNIEFFFVFNFNDNHNFIEMYDFIVPKDKEKSVESILYWHKIYSVSTQGINFRMYYESEELLNYVLFPGDYKITYEQIKMLEIIKQIEDALNIRFNFPKVISCEDIIIINEIFQIINTGVIKGLVSDNPKFIFREWKGLEYILNSEDEQYLQIVDIIECKKYSLFNKIVEVGKQITIYPVSVVDEQELLNKKIAICTEGDSIQIKFKIINDNSAIRIYPRYTTESEDAYLQASLKVVYDDISKSLTITPRIFQGKLSI